MADQVGHDEKRQVGHDEKRQVGHDEKDVIPGLTGNLKEDR